MIAAIAVIATKNVVATATAGTTMTAGITAGTIIGITMRIVTTIVAVREEEGVAEDEVFIGCTYSHRRQRPCVQLAARNGGCGGRERFADVIISAKFKTENPV